jgi:CRP-like cAMP-binding protein
MVNPKFPSRLSGPFSLPARFDGEGSELKNKILHTLPAEEQRSLLPRLEYTRLQSRHILYEPGETMNFVYFVNHGLISLVHIFPNGKKVEVGLVGQEGLVGLPVVAGFQTANTRAIVQIEAAALRLDTPTFIDILRRSPALQRRLAQYSLILGMETAQLAACNRLHEVNERLARWLLMSADIVGSNHVDLTQESISAMLGTRRSSVTVAAGTLQSAGLIVNSRGKIEIVDRERLEAASCDCYRTMRDQKATWRRESQMR